MKKINKRVNKLILILLLITFVFVNYTFLDRALMSWFSNYEFGVVERVIDGDTIVVNGTSVRLLGVNTPEKGDKYYSEAKDSLETSIKGELVRLEFSKEDRDLYNRKLRYVYFKEENVNLKLVEQGYANYYFPSGKDKYYYDFMDAWEKCIASGKNLCEPSQDACASCIKISNLDVKSQEISLINTCNFYCDMTNWTIKDEGRKVFVFPEFLLKQKVDIKVKNGTDSESTLFWKGENYVWTKTGDTLFLRDKWGRLVLWKNY